MIRKLVLTMAAAALMAGPAAAVPERVPHFVFATPEQCMAALSAFWRGNHAFYCTADGDGWYIAYDAAYEAAKRGPKKR